MAYCNTVGLISLSSSLVFDPNRHENMAHYLYLCLFKLNPKHTSTLYYDTRFEYEQRALLVKLFEFCKLYTTDM